MVLCTLCIISIHLDPGVLQHFTGGEALLWPHYQTMADKLFGRLRDVLPEGVGEGELSRDNVSKQVSLAPAMGNAKHKNILGKKQVLRGIEAWFRSRTIRLNYHLLSRGTLMYRGRGGGDSCYGLVACMHGELVCDVC